MSGAFKVNSEIKTTTCYMCACRCGFRVHLRDGAVRYIEGNPAHRADRTGSHGGSFNTREFFHGRPREVVRAVRWTFLALVFPVPGLLLVLWPGSGSNAPGSERVLFLRPRRQ
jgi:molybdopterin-dependent oxidoreductase iron-sulfur protein